MIVGGKGAIFDRQLHAPYIETGKYLLSNFKTNDTQNVCDLHDYKAKYSFSFRKSTQFYDGFVSLLN